MGSRWKMPCPRLVPLLAILLCITPAVSQGDSRSEADGLGNDSSPLGIKGLGARITRQATTSEASELTADLSKGIEEDVGDGDGDGDLSMAKAQEDTRINEIERKAEVHFNDVHFKTY
jgi:hypothetical protein